MTNNEIKIMRMKIGKYLHNYFMVFGEKEYDRKLSDIAKEMKIYGDSFSKSNLRIMEAEYLTFSSNVGANYKSKSKKIITKE